MHGLSPPVFVAAGVTTVRVSIERVTGRLLFRRLAMSTSVYSCVAYTSGVFVPRADSTGFTVGTGGVTMMGLMTSADACTGAAVTVVGASAGVSARDGALASDAALVVANARPAIPGCVDLLGHVTPAPSTTAGTTPARLSTTATPVRHRSVTSSLRIGGIERMVFGGSGHASPSMIQP